MYILKYLEKLNPFILGFLTLNIGIFFLFSAPAVASFFLIVSLFLSIFLFEKNPLKDKINLIFLLISFLMILSCYFFKFNSQEFLIDYKSKYYTPPFISLINWIPLFFCYFGFQNYLKTKKDRFICSMSLIFGSIPILISGFGQYLFGWYGPLEFLNGLIIWYQREITIGMKGMTGLFNNANYTACALATICPIFYATFFKNKNLIFKKIISLFFIFLVIIGILFTSSRNGLLALLLGTFIFLIPLKSKLLSFSFLSFLSIFLLNFISNYILNTPLIPFKLINKINFEALSTDPRISIWKESINYIVQNPLLGWGGNNFSSLWNSNNSFYLGHSHSVPLEISIQYGLITSTLLSGTIIFILLKSFRTIFLASNFKIINFRKDNFFDRGWYSACLIILFSNTIDILYFDIRISVLCWLLLAGLRNISQEQIR